MATHDVAELVANDVSLLLAIEQREHPRVEHDERLVEADRRRIYEWRLRDIELRLLRPIHRLEHFLIEREELRPLGRSDAHRIRQKELPDSLLAEETGNLADYFIEAGKGTQRIEGCA